MFVFPLPVFRHVCTMATFAQLPRLHNCHVCTIATFAQLPIATISFVMSVRLSVHSHRTTLFPLDGFASIFFLVFGLSLARQSPVGQGLFIKKASRSHPVRHASLGRTPLDEWSVRRRDLYLTTHNTHTSQKSMPSGGIRTHNHSRRAAADLRLTARPLGSALYLSTFRKYVEKIQVYWNLTRITGTAHKD